MDKEDAGGRTENDIRLRTYRREERVKFFKEAV